MYAERDACAAHIDILALVKLQMSRTPPRPTSGGYNVMDIYMYCDFFAALLDALLANVSS